MMTELTDDTSPEALAAMNEELILINRLVRHDIRNDMATALGWAEELEAHVDEEGEPMLERVIDAIQRTIDLTTTSRDFIEALVTDHERLGPVPLREILTEQVERLRRRFEEPHVELGEVPPVDVRANDLLESVVWNVLENAVNHNDRDEPHVTVTAERDDGTVTVRIADDGPGIAPERHDAVFGREVRAPDDPVEGLGLRLVAGCVEAYDGDVWIEDNDPRGTVVAIRLPLAEDGGDAAPAATNAEVRDVPADSHAGEGER